jgi:hypothetical protein
MDTPKGMVIDTDGKERTDTAQVSSCCLILQEGKTEGVVMQYVHVHFLAFSSRSCDMM